MAIVSRAQPAKTEQPPPAAPAVGSPCWQEAAQCPPEKCIWCWAWQEILAQNPHLMRKKRQVCQGAPTYSWSAPQEVAVMLPQAQFAVLVLQIPANTSGSQLALGSNHFMTREPNSPADKNGCLAACHGVTWEEITSPWANTGGGSHSTGFTASQRAPSACFPADGHLHMLLVRASRTTGSDSSGYWSFQLAVMHFYCRFFFPVQFQSGHPSTHCR